MSTSEPEGRSEARHRVAALFDVLREGVALCEMIRNEAGAVVDYRILEGNPAFLRGLGGGKALGKTLRELRPDVSDRWYAMWQRIMEAGKPTRWEYEDRRAGRWYDVHITPLGRDQVVQLYIDVTQRKQAEAHLAHLFNELNHRVKNNLMMVTAMLTMQARTSKLPEVQEELLQAVDRVQSISDVHAILYKTGAVEAVKFDAYLEELCRRLGSAAADRGVDIELEAAPLEVPSEDAVQMGIVVNELITNAVKHAYPPPQKGKIIVSLSAADDQIRLSVRDFGPGLPAEDQCASGLGMRLVRSLVEKRGGTLAMESAGGLDVQVTLPDRSRETPAVRLS
jgi:two-component sensor histidine kinase